MLVLIFVLYPKPQLLILQRPEMGCETIPTAWPLGCRVASFGRGVWSQSIVNANPGFVLVVFQRTHH